MKRLVILSFLLALLLPILSTAQQQIKKEINKERDFYVKKFKLDKNKYQVKFSSRPVHYKDETGQFKDIKLYWRQEGNTYINSENTFVTRADVGNVVIKYGQNDKLLFNDFKLNTRKMNFDNISELPQNKIGCNESNDLPQMVLTSLQAALKLQFKNLKTSTEEGLSISFKIDGDFSSNAAIIKNGRLFLNDRFFLTAPRIETNFQSALKGQFEIAEQTDNNIIVGISWKTSHAKSPETVYSVQTILSDDVALGVVGQFPLSYDSNGDEANISGDDDNLVIGWGNNKYRTMQLFNIENYLPDDVNITGARHQFTIESGEPNEDIEVVRVTGIDPLTTGSTIWSTIGNSSTIYDTFKPGDYSYEYDKTYSESDQMCTDIENDNNAAGTYYFGIGIRLDDEDETAIEFESALSLIVTYEYPQVTITADNNFSVSGGGHGSINVDGGDPEEAPYEFEREITTNCNLEAISNQTDSDGYLRVWNTSSCGQISEWRKNGNELISNDRITSFTVALDDDHSTYTANFTPQIVTTGGDMSSDETWFTNIVLTNTVVVPYGITLTITPCSMIDFNGYNLMSVGGTINIQSGGRITLNSAQFPEGGGSGGTYQTNGTTVGSTFNGIGQAIGYFKICNVLNTEQWIERCVLRGSLRGSIAF